MSVIIIEDWMIEREKLKGLDLLAFALTHSCTQKGNGCWYGGYDKLAQRIGATQRGAVKCVKSLEESGFILKFDAIIEGKTRKAFKSLKYTEQSSENAVQTERSSDEQNSEENVQIASLFPERSSDDNNKNNNKKIYSEDVERLYAIYPASCPKRGTSTGKCWRDKDKLNRLLKVYPFNVIEQKLNAYVEENLGKHYMLNFSTFLSRIDDMPSTATPSTNQTQVTPAKKSTPVSGFKIASGGLLDGIEY